MKKETELGFRCWKPVGSPGNDVECCRETGTVPPVVWVPNQLVASPLGEWITLECHCEAQPRPIAYWVRTRHGANNGANNGASNGVDDDLVLLPNRRVRPEALVNGFRTHMKLTIQRLEAHDLGHYQCLAKNSIGEAEGSIRLIGISFTSYSRLGFTGSFFFFGRWRVEFAFMHWVSFSRFPVTFEFSNLT